MAGMLDGTQEFEAGQSSSKRGRFIVIDGVDGCGKSTQAELLRRALGVPAELHLREPGSTLLGEAVREILLSQRFEIGAEVETLLFAASRRQMLDQLVSPALKGGADVVCERFNSSTFAYQAVAGDLDPALVVQLLRDWASQPGPDLVLILDVDVELAASRRGEPGDRIEAKGLEFQRRVALGYRRYAEEFEAARLIDGSGSSAEVHDRILAEVQRVGV
jgi:dTMP kinase